MIRCLPIVLMAVVLTAFADAPRPPAPTVAAAVERGAIVTAEPRLNVRSNPGQRYEVVARLETGARVTVVEQRGDWLGIVAPPTAEAWVALKHLSNDRIAVEHAPLYSGPGAYFSIYRNLDRGTPVNVVRQTEGTWAQVTPPPGTVAWVHGSFVKLDPLPETGVAPAAGGAEPPAVPTTSPAAGPVVPVNPPASDASLETIGIAEPVAQVGYVIPLGSEKGPWTYALAHRVNGTFYPFAYLDKSRAEVPSWAWKRVIVRGTSEWLKGWPRPRLTIESIEAAGAGE